MKNRNRTTPDEEIAHYEGLIFATAFRYVDRVEGELDDLQQLLRIKVWKALVAYDPSRCRTSRNSFIFGAIRNETKDWMRYKRLSRTVRLRAGDGEVEVPLHVASMDEMRGADSLAEAWRRESFDGAHLSTNGEVFRDVEDEPPLIPSTLSRLELQVVCLMYEGYRQTEIARYLSVEKRDIEKAVKGIRTKMADWSPDLADRVCPMPVASPGDGARELAADAG